jgi:hypothetical protein
MQCCQVLSSAIKRCIAPIVTFGSPDVRHTRSHRRSRCTYSFSLKHWFQINDARLLWTPWINNSATVFFVFAFFESASWIKLRMRQIVRLRAIKKIPSRNCGLRTSYLQLIPVVWAQNLTVQVWPHSLRPENRGNSTMAGIQAVKPPSFQSSVEPDRLDLLKKAPLRKIQYPQTQFCWIRHYQRKCDRQWPMFSEDE